MLEGKSILVTGGASFIGSHLVDALVDRNLSVAVVDDLSTGKLENIIHHLDNDRINFIHADLRQPGVAKDAVNGVQVVFHLAADHGGRGYIDLHQAGPASNLLLDGLIFWEAHHAGVKKIIYASSGCVYPNSLQTDPGREIYLNEDTVRPPYDADNLYGWAKLMGELSLKAYSLETALKTASCRYFTVYGPRCMENHAVMAMIARSFVRQDPFEVWGDGSQIRNWTFVDDVVEGTIAAAEKIDDGTAVNIGTMERVCVTDAAELIMKITGYRSKIKFLKDMPTGPLNRVADNSLAKKLLGWEPQTRFQEGVKRTIDWYFSSKKTDEVEAALKEKLLKR